MPNSNDKFTLTYEQLREILNNRCYDCDLCGSDEEIDEIIDSVYEMQLRGG